MLNLITVCEISNTETPFSSVFAYSRANSHDTRGMMARLTVKARVDRLYICHRAEKVEIPERGSCCYRYSGSCHELIYVQMQLLGFHRKLSSGGCRADTAVGFSWKLSSGGCRGDAAVRV